MATETATIPEPPGLPLIGNAPIPGLGSKINAGELADKYGPIFRLRLGGRSIVFVSNHELVNEVCDERRFHKSILTALKQVREGVQDGLFTSFEGEETWDVAHRVLIPAFGPLPIRSMFDEMHDISSQLALKLARQGPDVSIHATEDFTRLALDTLALCSMDYRFNSFYRDEMHPFVRAMGDFLSECGRRNHRPGILPEWAYRKANERFYADIKTMRDIADQIIETRRKSPRRRKDLLGAMLDGVDKRTGEKLSDDNITNQLITFLIAGHETTSGTLSFAFYNLLKNPDGYKKMQKEIDSVIGRNSIRLEHLSKLPYTAAVLRETLRLNSPIPGLSLESPVPTLLAGKYHVSAGEPVNCLLGKLHFDPLVYGPDADQFKPERMLEDVHVQRLKQFPNCWKPFGNGKRGCIGRPFAWQEMMLAMAILFQNFDFEMVDPDYELQIVRTLTLKPGDFKMRARLRHELTATQLQKQLAGEGLETSRAKAPSSTCLSASVPECATKRPMAIYYGSNSGTCEAMAQQLAANSRLHGFRTTALAPLDEATQSLTGDRPVVIITSSYDGKPPSNSEAFFLWLESLKGNEARNVGYAVFGCGHRDWIDTFHRVPKLVDGKLEERGATRLTPLTCTDAADRDMFSDFERWEDEMLWPALKNTYGVGEAALADAGGVEIEIKQPPMDHLQRDVKEATVVGERTLTSSEAHATKKHIDIQLPQGMDYKLGDYLNVRPQNQPDSIERVLRHFRLSPKASLRIRSDSPTTLPTGRDCWIKEVLASYVEINQPATRRNIFTLADNTERSHEASAIRALAANHNPGDAPQASVLDLLERYPSASIPFAAYLSMLPPMRSRQYSISSSPLPDSTRASLTYSILSTPSLTHKGQHWGVATSYLSTLRPGDRLPVSVRPSKSSFRLPDPGTPIITIAAGAGLAPFRGFIQERSILASQGAEVAPTLLFFGCRGPEDDLYADEIAQWEDQGVVTVRRAYSQAGKRVRYVQDKILDEHEAVCAVWKEGARVYVCGSKKMAKAAEEACVKVLRQGLGGPEDSDMAWWTERFSADVFD